MTDLHERLGVARRINAAGTLTRLGGSLMAAEVLDAMREAAGHSVDIAELQTAASAHIAAATGAQAGIVTSGASAALTLAVAACLARWDVARMAALPDTSAMPNRVLMARTQRNSYDHAIRVAGGQIVDIGHNDRGTGAGIRGLEAWEIDAAIDAQTVAFVFVATADSVASLPMIVQTVHAHGLPVIVDAAAQLPPRDNLHRFIAAGADLVLFSGGKAIGGPQSSGILAGRRDLIGSALVQMMDMDVHPQTWSASPLIDRSALKGIPHHGIGRGFKVGKEEIAGLLTALQIFTTRDEAAFSAALRQRLTAIATALSGATSCLSVRLEGDDSDCAIPTLQLRVHGSAQTLSRALQQGNPPVHLGEGRMDAGILILNPLTVRADDDATLVSCLLAACQTVTTP
ncbi:MAG: aminotransferase class V-fold PLP-dependent enzyme [Burkholderiaceae bacterium]